MKAIQYIRLIGKEFISLTDAELHLWVEMVRPKAGSDAINRRIDAILLELLELKKYIVTAEA